MFQDQIQAIEDFNGDTFDCSATDLQSAASTLEDLAKLIKELGMERIRSYLGVDIGLDKIIRKWKYKSNSGITKQLSYIKKTGHNSNILQDYYKNKRNPKTRKIGPSIQQNSNLGDIVKKYKTQSNYNPNVNYSFGKGYNLQDFSFGNSQPYIEKNNYSNYGKAPQRQRSDISQRYKAHFNIGVTGSHRRPSFKTVLKGKAWKLKNIYGPRRNTGLWASASYF